MAMNPDIYSDHKWACTSCTLFFPNKQLPHIVEDKKYCTTCKDAHFSSKSAKFVLDTTKEVSKYVQLGQEIGALVERKQAAYGDSFGKSAEFLKLLWPEGVPVHSYNDLLAIIRIFDKLKRIATDKDAMGEDPFFDICGYSLLSAAYTRDTKK